MMLVLALPIAALVAVIVRWIWTPVARLLVLPMVRRFQPTLDPKRIQPYVALGAFAGSIAGWVFFVLTHH
jgi:hypothetical protein